METHIRESVTTLAWFENRPWERLSPGITRAGRLGCEELRCAGPASWVGGVSPLGQKSDIRWAIPVTGCMAVPL